MSNTRRIIKLRNKTMWSYRTAFRDRPSDERLNNKYFTSVLDALLDCYEDAEYINLLEVVATGEMNKVGTKMNYYLLDDGKVKIDIVNMFNITKDDYIKFTRELLSHAVCSMKIIPYTSELEEHLKNNKEIEYSSIIGKINNTSYKYLSEKHLVKALKLYLLLKQGVAPRNVFESCSAAVENIMLCLKARKKKSDFNALVELYLPF